MKRKSLVWLLACLALILAPVSGLAAEAASWWQPSSSWTQPANFAHTVRPGDTLYLLAQRYGTSVLAIMEANNYWSTMIFPGQVLLIPEARSSSAFDGNSGQVLQHKVRWGDTLYLLARHYGTTINAIMRVNNLHSTMIFAGQTLLIPYGKGADAPADWDRGNERVVPHRVSPGETLYLIAQRYGTTVYRLMEYNNYWSTWIFPGQFLLVPVDAPQPPAPPQQPPAQPPQQPPAQPPVEQPGEPGDGSDSPLAYEILGYYAEDFPGDDISYDSLTKFYKHIDSVGSFQFTVDASGNLSAKDYSRMMSFAKEKGIKVLALIHNLVQGGFDRNIAHQVLTVPSVRSRFINNTLSILKQYGFDGVNIDIENVDPADRQAYTGLIKELADALKPEGFLVTLSIPAKTADNPNHGWSGGFDYKELGKYADQIMIMSYDEHWYGGPIGPVASLPWVQQVAQYVASQIPPEKVLFGIAGYGYDWVADGQTLRMMTYKDVLADLEKYGVQLQWDDQAKVPYYNFNDGRNHAVYFENARSTAYKLDVVVKHGFAGIALWRLGQEDPAIWPLVEQKLR